MVRHGLREETHAAPCRDEGEDLLEARGVRRNASGQAAPSLLGEPPGGRSVFPGDRVDDEALLAQVRERQPLMAGEWMRAG
jgi:hypothetical protein